MVGGKDVTMNSLLNLANQISDDSNVTVWQYWIAVSCYDFRDGLIYVDLDTKEIEPTKRLWAMGNFSKFIRPEATQFEVSATDGDINTVVLKIKIMVRKFRW